jgi:hypothetical protein
MPPVKSNGQESPEYQLTSILLTELQETWKRLYAEHGKDPMLFSRMSVVAFSQLAAVMAVDVEMNLQQFTAVCKAQHEIAYKQAPKFG